MKKTIIAILQLQLITPTLLAAALPEDWEVDLAAKQPQVFTLQRPRGETYELKAVLKRHGKPFEPAITNACIYWQTNGMENLYWSAPASVSNNVLRATWLPSMDPGATTVRGYIGDPGHIYAAAFQFRFIASPGALPNALPLPTPVIDFARIRVLNPPWGSGGGGGCDTNAVDILANSAVVTNALTVATTNRIAALETATNNLSSSVSGLANTKADRSALTAHTENTDNPHGVTAEQIGALSISPYPASDQTFNWSPSGGGIRLFGTHYGTGIGLTLWSGGGYLVNYHDGTEDWYRLPTGKSGTLAIVDDISAANPTFSNEVATVARTVTPPPSPTLRLYDEVRQCYWIGRMINGVINWEVE